jgi:hypothetical protein
MSNETCHASKKTAKENFITVGGINDKVVYLVLRGLRYNIRSLPVPWRRYGVSPMSSGQEILCAWVWSVILPRQYARSRT